MRLAQPLTGVEELEEIREVLETGYLTQGPKVSEFETMVKEYIDSRYSFAMSSCTTALHMSLVVLDVGPGDEVIVPDFTFPATANVVVQKGALPVLADIELSTFSMDPESLLSKITPRTKAIMPVHPFGSPAQMDEILTAAGRIPVVEDAACALGALYRDKYCGTIGTIGCFSFHPRKIITTGEGGLIATDREDLAERIRLLRNHGGIKAGNRYEFQDAGYNYRLSDIHGAIGIAQMRKLPLILEKRKSSAFYLSSLLRDERGIRIPLNPDWGTHAFQSYVVLLDENIDRDKVIERMYEKGIETTLGTYSLHVQPYFRKTLRLKRGQVKNSLRAFEGSITLPLYPQMTEKDLDFLAETFKEAVRYAGA